MPRVSETTMDRMMSFTRCALAMLVTAVTLTPASAVAQETVPADRFVDSVGVNVHLHYGGWLYREDFPLIKARLIELGVRHIRDGLVDTKWLPYYDRHNELGRAGIKGVFIAGPRDTAEFLAEYPTRMKDAFEAYEAPNEYNTKKDVNWAQTLTQAMARLRSLQDVPGVSHFPVYGPSLTTEAAYAALGDLSYLFDAANLHNYFGGRHPGTGGWGSNGYGSIAWNLNLARGYGGGKQVVTTETGYRDDLSVVDSVPQEVAGLYMPRVLLQQFRAGIIRTYMYELADATNSGNWGLLEEDGAPKPAFRAVKGLLNLLADPGPAHTPQDLSYSVLGGTSDVHHMAFQKRNGRYYLALWLELPSYNQNTREPQSVTAQSVSVTLPTAMRQLRTHRWQPDGSVSTSSSTVRSARVVLSVTDALTVIELAR